MSKMDHIVILKHLLRLGQQGSRGGIWRWICLPRRSDIEEHSVATTTSTEACRLSQIQEILSIALCNVHKHISENSQQKVYLQRRQQNEQAQHELQSHREQVLLAQTIASDSSEGNVYSFSMICLFRVPDAGLSRHASDIKKIYEG